MGDAILRAPPAEAYEPTARAYCTAMDLVPHEMVYPPPEFEHPTDDVMMARWLLVAMQLRAEDARRWTLARCPVAWPPAHT